MRIKNGCKIFKNAIEITKNEKDKRRTNLILKNVILRVKLAARSSLNKMKESNEIKPKKLNLYILLDKCNHIQQIHYITSIHRYKLESLTEY